MDESKRDSELAADDARFAANMQAVRETKGLSQADLVRLLRANGWSTVHQTTVSRIEKGERSVKLGEARVIARTLGVELSQMLLTAASARIAIDLVAHRHEMEVARRTMRQGAIDFYTEKQKLDRIIEKLRAEGYEPAMPASDEQWIPPVSDGSIESELALAVYESGLDPVKAIDVGRILAGVRQDQPDENDHS